MSFLKTWLHNNNQNGNYVRIITHFKLKGIKVSTTHAQFVVCVINFPKIKQIFSKEIIKSQAITF